MKYRPCHKWNKQCDNEIKSSFWYRKTATLSCLVYYFPFFWLCSLTSQVDMNWCGTAYSKWSFWLATDLCYERNLSSVVYHCMCQQVKWRGWGSYSWGAAVLSEWPSANLDFDPCAATSLLWIWWALIPLNQWNTGQINGLFVPHGRNPSKW